MLRLLGVIIRAVRLATIASVELPALDEVAHLIIVQLLLLQDLIRVLILRFGKPSSKEKHLFGKPDRFQ